MRSIENEYSFKGSAFDIQLKASCYEGAARRTREKLMKYERLDAERFTEQLVTQVTSELPVECSGLDDNPKPKKNKRFRR